MSGLIDDTIQSVRKIASRLRRRLDNLGLTPPSAGTQRIFASAPGSGAIALPSDMLMLDRERSTAAFRIFQELLTNVARHANATRVDSHAG